MRRDTPEKFSLLTVFLHWVIALTVIGMLAVGFYMAEFSVYSLYGWHKSVGVLILAVIVLRVLWRWFNGWPVPVTRPGLFERLLAKTVAWILLLGSLLMPLSGMLMSAYSGNGIAVFGRVLVATNPDPFNPGKNLPLNGELASLGHEVHEITGLLLLVALALHLAGVIKHHLIQKDGTLHRMLGSRI